MKTITLQEFLKLLNVNQLLQHLRSLNNNTNNFVEFLNKITIEKKVMIIDVISEYYYYDDLKNFAKQLQISATTKYEICKTIVNSIDINKSLNLFEIFRSSLLIDTISQKTQTTEEFKEKIITDLLPEFQNISSVIFFLDKMNLDYLKAIIEKLHSLDFIEFKIKNKKDIIEYLSKIIIIENSEKISKPKNQDEIYNKLLKLRIKSSELESEKDAEYEIKKYLIEFFPNIKTQYFVGGNFGAKIDIDINNGEYGIEIKLTSSLLSTTSEIFRLIGQVLYYKKRMYNDNLLLVLVGYQYDNNKPAIKELFELLDSHNVNYICVELY